jgi:hypothetical protein
VLSACVSPWNKIQALNYNRCAHAVKQIWKELLLYLAMLLCSIHGGPLDVVALVVYIIAYKNSIFIRFWCAQIHEYGWITKD